MPAATRESRLLALPPELIASILSHLSPEDLGRVEQTCRALYSHATADHLWQAHVQDNVPGVRVTSPYPYDTFHELYWAHYPRWFLPKYKIWFADVNLPGRLIVVRYDQRRGCIEGYQVVASNRNRTFHTWSADSDVIIPNFDPAVKLHLDHPILHLPPNPKSEAYERRVLGTIRSIRLRRGSNDAGDGRGSVGSGSCSNRGRLGGLREHNHFQGEIPMDVGSINTMHNNFMYARCLDPETIAEHIKDDFPYGGVWPPPSIPTPHHVLGAGLNRAQSIGSEDRPTSRQDLSDRAFRIRKWLEVRLVRGAALIPEPSQNSQNPTFVYELTGPAAAATAAAAAGASQSSAPASPPQITVSTIHPLPHGPDATATEASSSSSAAAAAAAAASGPADETDHHDVGHANPDIPLPLGIHIGEEVSTYATLDPALYTPTRSKPYRGIWVGDYSIHGCEFLWLHQPDDDNDDDDDDDDDYDDDNNNLDGDDAAAEPEPEPARARVRVRGRLEAIKLTGDAHVPRGELTFVAADLGDGGLIGVAQEPPFEGVRVVRSRGHVANSGFMSGQYLFFFFLFLLVALGRGF